MLEAKSTLLAALKDTLPFSLGVFAYGTVYGILSRAGHLTMGETLSMSALVFAGASQFVALASSLVARVAWFFLGSGWSVAAGALTACLLGVVSGEA